MDFKSLVGQDNNTALIADYLHRTYEVITLNFVSNEEELQKQMRINANSDPLLQQALKESLNQNEQQEIQQKVQPSSYLNPTYTHQIFGDDEQIKGYKDLKIDIYFTTGRLYPFINVSYTDKTPDADNFMDNFDTWFFSNYTTDLNKFKQELKIEQIYQPCGENIGTYQYQNEEYVVFKSNNQYDGFTDLRLGTWPLLLFFIEVASYCHQDDYWVYYSLYKKQQNGQYEFAGVITLTEFHIDVKFKRNRISQVFILPQFQRQGHAVQLTEIVYKDCIQDQDCLQITVEDCSPEFQVIRDIVECKLVLFYEFFDWYKEYPTDSIVIPSILDNLKNDKQILNIIKKKLKITTTQTNRVFEILLLSKINKKNNNLIDMFQKIIQERIKASMEQPKRKVPFIIFEGEKKFFDVEAITQMQNKQFNQESFYENSSKSTLDEYKPVLKRLGLLNL